MSHTGNHPSVTHHPTHNPTHHQTRHEMMTTHNTHTLHNLHDEVYSTPYMTIGFFILAILIGIIALFIAGYALSGHISFRTNSVPGKALKDESVSLGAISSDSLSSGTIESSGHLTVNGDTSLEKLTARSHVLIYTTAKTLSASQSGSTILWNIANAALTLPPAAEGLEFTVVLGINATAGCNILTHSNTQSFFGTIPLYTTHGTADQTGVQQQVTYAVSIAAPASYDAMKFVHGTNTLGGVAGEVIHLRAVSNVAWLVDIPNHATTDAAPGTLALIQAR